EPEVARYAGYRLEYTDKKSDYIKQVEKRYKYTSLYESLGFAVNSDKTISDIIPESPADSAGMYPGMEIAGVNGKKYSKERLTDAVKQTKESGSIMFLTLAGDEFREIEIIYDKGLQYYILTPLEGFPDRISDIMKPVVTAEIDE
ncbi:MAG: PDZ domain-containing protein, partial [candidate division Zixibacteria bacterium]